MTMTTPRLEIDPAYVPDELVLASTRSREKASWLVQVLKPRVMTPCGICNELLSTRERAVYEEACMHPSHVECWLLQLTARPVRIITVSYR